VVGWRTRAGRDPAPVVEIPGSLVERKSLAPRPHATRVEEEEEEGPGGY